MKVYIVQRVEYLPAESPFPMETIIGVYADYDTAKKSVKKDNDPNVVHCVIDHEGIGGERKWKKN